MTGSEHPPAGPCRLAAVRFVAPVLGPPRLMDAHTLTLLEFNKVRELVATRAASSLGKERARALGPLRDVGAIQHRQALTTEMTEALAAGLAPPVGGLRDIRTAVHRAQTGAALAAEELAEIAGVLRTVG